VTEENTHREAWGTQSRENGQAGSDPAADAGTRTVPMAPRRAGDDGDHTEISTVPLGFQAEHSDWSRGAGPQTTHNHVALPAGHQLNEYTLEAVLGSGGFGITYLARDNNLQCQVAIKEYLPTDLAVRTAGCTVCARTEAETHGYRIGLERFLAEARVLASFRHRNIVRVTRFFEANNTAYMVMDYERGLPLRDWARQHAEADEAQLLKMFLPLLDGLEVVHRAGVVHRDIKPANIYVREEDGSLVLLDFGAARYASTMDSRSLTTMVTPGFAPLEQYHAHGAQGPWSDLYAFGGVLYWMVTGEKPLEAPSRVRKDTMPSALALAGGRYSERLLRAIDWALTPDEADRPKSVSQLRAVLTGEAAAPPVAAVRAHAAQGWMAGRRALLLAAAAFALLAVAGYVLYPKGQPPQAETAPSATAPIPPAPQQPAAEAEPATGQKATGQTAAARPAAKSKEKTAPAGPTGTLILDVRPHGEIVLNGRKAGVSPPLTRLVVPAGVKHKIEIHGSGLPHYWTVELQPGEKREIRADFESRNY
jgi:hypothetical protein